MLSASLALSSALRARACSSMLLSKADIALNPDASKEILLRFIRCWVPLTVELSGRQALHC